MKVLFSLNKSDYDTAQIQFINLRATLESDRENYAGVVEIVMNEYAVAAYINLHSVYGSEFGLKFCTQSPRNFHNNPRFMMDEDKELDVSMVLCAYDVFEEPPEDEESEYEDDYDEYEPEDDQRSD